MALTRPKIWDLDTNIEYFMDPITVLHQGAVNANVDVGFLFNRANGLVSNVALYWSEGSQSFITAFTANTGTTDSNIAVSSYANLTIGNLLMVQGSILGVVGNLSIGGINAATIGNTGAQGIFGTVSTSGNINIGGNIIYGPQLVTEITNTVTSIGAGATQIDNFANTTIRTAKYIVSTQDVVNSWTQATEILLAQDGANVNIVTYGILYTGPSQRMTFSANMAAGNVVTLYATGVSTNNTVKYTRTGIPL